MGVVGLTCDIFWNALVPTIPPTRGSWSGTTGRCIATLSCWPPLRGCASRSAGCPPTHPGPIPLRSSDASSSRPPCITPWRIAETTSKRRPRRFSTRLRPDRSPCYATLACSQAQTEYLITLVDDITHVLRNRTVCVNAHSYCILRRTVSLSSSTWLWREGRSKMRKASTRSLCGWSRVGMRTRSHATRSWMCAAIATAFG